MSEKIFGIIDAVDYSGNLLVVLMVRMVGLKKRSHLALTTDRLIVARGSTPERVAELTPEGILSTGKKNFAISWHDVTKVETEYTGPRGEFRAKVLTLYNKYLFGEIKGRMLSEFQQILNMIIPDKVTVPKYREKFDRELSKLENTPVDVLCAHLCSLGFEAEIRGLEERDKKLMAYLDKGVAEIKGRNIAYIINERKMLNWMITCILQNVAGKWKSTQTKKRGEQDFEWVGDKKISDVLNQDTSMKNALLEEMQAKEIDIVGIAEPEDNVAGIRVITKDLPTKRLLEAVDRIASHLHQIA